MNIVKTVINFIVDVIYVAFVCVVATVIVNFVLLPLAVAII